MDWIITQKGDLAYKVKGNQIFITDQISQYQDGSYEVRVEDNDDFYVNTLVVNDDGTLKMDDWMDLRQFNNSNNLGPQIKLINKIVAQLTNTPAQNLDLETELKKDPIFVTSNINGKDELYDLTATLSIGEDSYSLEKQFIKYTFIDSKICARTWTVQELYNFWVHLQVFLYRQEKEMGGDMVLQVDPDVEASISK